MSVKASRESDVLKACLSLLQMRGVWCFRANQGAIPLPGGKGFRRFVGARGMADILGILSGHGWKLPRFPEHLPGRFLAVECKKKGGRQSKEQEEFGRRVTEAGGAYKVIYDVKELDNWLNELGV